MTRNTYPYTHTDQGVYRYGVLLHSFPTFIISIIVFTDEEDDYIHVHVDGEKVTDVIIYRHEDGRIFTTT